MSDALVITDLFGTRNMIEVSINRIKEFEFIAKNMNPSGYYVAISGGKDSSVIYDLVKKSGVCATYHHGMTTIDAPQTMQHLRRYYPDVTMHRPPVPLWKKITTVRTSPPARAGRRWCCRDYKERGGTGYMVITGVRAAESARRHGYRIMETCVRTKSKRFLHPIIDWTDEMVWEYIHRNQLPINPLYLPPFNHKRVGCVLCPLALPNIEEQCRKHWPRMVSAWERAIKTWFIRFGNECCDIKSIKTPEEYWRWWLSGQTTTLPDENQECLIFEEPKEET